MKLGLTNVNGDFYKVVEVNTIKQLIELMKKCGYPFILEDNYFYGINSSADVPQEYKNCKYSIEIYDDCRE